MTDKLHQTSFGVAQFHFLINMSFNLSFYLLLFSIAFCLGHQCDEFKSIKNWWLTKKTDNQLIDLLLLEQSFKILDTVVVLGRGSQADIHKTIYMNDPHNLVAAKVFRNLDMTSNEVFQLKELKN